MSISNREINELKELLVRINDKLTKLEERVTEIEKSTKNMDNHISFVDGVYDSVKTPFHRMMNLINFRLPGSDEIPTKALENNPNLIETSNPDLNTEQN